MKISLQFGIVCFMFSTAAYAGFGDFAKSISGAAPDVVGAVVESRKKEEPASAPPEKTPAAQSAAPKTKVGQTFKSLPSGMKNAKLENEILAIAKEISNPEWGTPKAVKLEDADWYIERNKLSGIIEARKMGARIYSVAADGRCSYQSLGFAQDYDGSKYLSTYYDGFSGAHELLDCE